MSFHSYARLNTNQLVVLICIYLNTIDVVVYVENELQKLIADNPFVNTILFAQMLNNVVY